MHNRQSLRVFLGAGLLAVLAVSPLEAQEAAESVVIQQPVTQDLYLAGRYVDVLANVDGDVIAAGQRIAINQEVTGDVIAAGETVTLRGNVLDDVRAAGRVVTLFGSVGDHILAAGQTVVLGPDATIGSWAWLAGESVEIAGQIAGELKVAASNVVISGSVDGDVLLTAEEIDIQPGALIRGNFTWRSENPPVISSEANIEGQIIEQPLPVSDLTMPTGTAAIFLAVSLMVAGIVLYLLFPRFSASAAEATRTHPWTCLGLGLVVLIVTPIAVALLMVTAVGFLLALALLALYLVMLLCGNLTGLFSLGGFGLWLLGKQDEASKGLRVLSIVAAVVVLGLIQFVPVLGGLAVFLVLLLGLGALQLQFYRAYRAARLQPILGESPG